MPDRVSLRTQRDGMLFRECQVRIIVTNAVLSHQGFAHARIAHRATGLAAVASAALTAARARSGVVAAGTLCAITSTSLAAAGTGASVIASGADGMIDSNDLAAGSDADALTNGRAGFAKELLVDLVGFVESRIALRSVTVEPEVRVMVEKFAEDILTVRGVCPGVQDVLMPEVVDQTVRHSGEVGVPEADLEIAAIPRFGFVCGCLAPALAFRGRLHDLAFDLRQIECCDGRKAANDAAFRVHDTGVLTMN